MDDPQSYEHRVARLTRARRHDTAVKRAAVIKAIHDMRREDRPITRRAVIARAGVHRNFLYRHKDLADLLAEASTPPRASRHPDRISYDSALTDLAAARHRARELEKKIQILEYRLGAQGPELGPLALDRHPVVIELRQRIAQLEIQSARKDRTIAALGDDVDILRETNRSLVREYGLADS
ncbi:Uncharacterised protein [Mycobacteroides abscessus subsp. abscessus]|nr:DUF6262 family protein [Mycobacteroides abscessus]SKQ48013.1 Uncharacterised protein [Mycobacteroides abscessus subsp. massiliense]SLF34046.1 Uncharacterised protein [Mycobacteroides abscessus subsp. abscessus]SLF35378.1 Uncharacterised protein [Mycobacteroides abscessus subsp. abscessus]SLF35705.1 Uncharacterised protein [Mycobacteroides abscessus subsp. abscessus]SLH08566.1 Uncharacterised protein [Mycobacteroides abscessus subsp. abscessus]